MKNPAPVFFSFRTSNLLVLALSVSVLSFLGCSQSEHSPSESAATTAPLSEEEFASGEMDLDLEGADGLLQRSVGQAFANKKAPGSLYGDVATGRAAGQSEDRRARPENQGPAAFPAKPELPRFEIAGERLLEYNVMLSYRTDDVLRSREALYKIVSQYGYLTGSSSEADGRLRVHSRFRVKIEHLHEVIEQLRNVGELEAENISAVDHTEAMAWQARKARREVTRAARRKNAPATARTWAEKERLISAGEDSLDAAEHEKWKIRDRVAWANFTVTLVGPYAPASIEVPRFGNAFAAMIGTFLDFLYGLIVVSPFLALLGGLIWGVRWLWSRRRKRQNV